MDNPFKSPTIISLCTGSRGLERGIERVIGSIRTIAYVEIEAFIIQNLVGQMEQGVLAPCPVWSNLKTFPFDKFYGKVHGFIGGYPCQPFSIAGLQRGTDDPRHLWPFIKSGIRAARPIWCFFENVPGHIELGYREVRADLEELGYKVEEGIYSAEEVGATHQRKRLFIFAVRGVGLANTTSYGSRGRYSGEYPSELKGISRDKQEGHEIRGEIKGCGQPGSELAQPDSIGFIHGEPKEHSAQGGIDALGNLATACGKVTSDGRLGDGQAISQTEGLQGNDPKRSISSGGCNTEHDQFPAGPNRQQYEWEEPRTIEPGVGFTVNGYDYREDLLRMAGNGVVEQTAELAFKHLKKKHGL